MNTTDNLLIATGSARHLLVERSKRHNIIEKISLVGGEENDFYSRHGLIRNVKNSGCGISTRRSLKLEGLHFCGNLRVFVRQLTFRMDFIVTIS